MTKVCMLCGDTFPDATTFCAKDGSALRAAVQGDSLIGELFCDRYVVTELLGEGGMGAVYAASDVRLPQQVAIKVLREQGMADPTVVARFRQEAEAASRINHDRVARVTDFGFMKDGRAFLVMEFVGGRTLKQIVTERGPLDVAETSRIVTMVAEGLDAAHRLGIVHRDLKPDNVMLLDDAGGGVRVKVLDFGIAKVLHANEESAGQTKTGFVIGTPQWMSPEQIMGEPLDARSDVYALALLAYMMMTGRRAFEGKSAESEMMARLSSPPKPLVEVLPSVAWPVGLQELLNRTLARNVDDRPSGALAFAKEFATVVGSVSNTVATMSNSRAVSVGAADTPPAAAYSSFKTSESYRQSSLTDSPTGTTTIGGKVVAAVLGVAAIAAIGFFAVRQMSGSGGTPTETANPNSTVAAGAPTNDTVNRGTSTAPVVEMPTIPPPLVSNSPTTTAAEVSQRVPDPATRTTPPKTASNGANTSSPDSAKSSVGTPAAPATPRLSSAANAASIELKHLMDLADVDFVDKDMYEINARIRRFESLLPELGTPTDKGNAHLYIAMSYATMRDNAKACASLKTAEPLATQSAALRTNIDEWQKQLKCEL